jgi:hypothetical protein
MIIFTGVVTRAESVLVCTACYMQQPVALHEIFFSNNYGGKCEICSGQDTKLRNIIAYVSAHSPDGRTIKGRYHYILSDIGFYRVILIDRHKETGHVVKSRSSTQP